MQPSHDKPSLPKIMVSACLVGEAVRYDGRVLTVEDPVLEKWLAAGRVVPFCPEVAAGLPVPRPPAEIRAGSGGSVLGRTAIVRDVDGRDVTGAFILGAQMALDLCRQKDISIAILTERSPSCGSNLIYDGQFRARRIEGQGVTTALLRQNGIRVFSQHQFNEADRHYPSL